MIKLTTIETPVVLLLRITYQPLDHIPLVSERVFEFGFLIDVLGVFPHLRRLLPVFLAPAVLPFVTRRPTQNASQFARGLVVSRLLSMRPLVGRE